MSFLEILDTLFLKPLYLLFEVVYVMANKVVGNPGVSIIVLSLFMNFLVLPLYIRADKIQEEERALERKLQKGVDHIKRTFSGDERMMMFQTYYRQNHYKPVYVLRSAVSLFLQIPFFIAAYRFLSGLQLLSGVSFGPISDLGKPDGMLQIAGMSINVLPVIMTIINLVSCVIFTKGSPLKEKIQLYVMALFFLVFLYASPAGLVFYWTLNNVFSLVKTIFYKLKNPQRGIGILCSAAGIALAVYGIFFYQYLYPSLRRKVILAGIGVLMQMPFVYSMFRNRIKIKRKQNTGDKRVFLLGALFLAVLTGGLIPSAVIKASPLEFVDITYIYNPLWFIFSSFCLALGIFLIWTGVFYFLAKPSKRVYFDKAVWLFSGVAIIDYMFFGKNLGTLTSQLIYAYELSFMWKEQILNAIVVIAAVSVLYFIYRYRKKIVVELLAVGALALSCMTIINMVNIGSVVNNVKESEATERTPRFVLSSTGKNVIVLMIDKAIGGYVPYIFEEKPELKEKFSGFTYYSNTLSFGAHTNFGSPALFGGYEYTPAELNKRSNESLKSKQNEALKVMPVLFTQNDYDVTVCDPPYAGYQWVSDLTIYDEYPEIKSFFMRGKFTDISIKEQRIKDNKRNFFCYGIFKSVPICMQGILYDKGKYNMIESDSGISDYSGQQRYSLYESEGLNASFMDSYNVLVGFPFITDIAEDAKNTFLMVTNETTHDPILLQEPEYIPVSRVDNTRYEKGYPERLDEKGNVLKMETDQQVMHYQANMAVMIKLGEWFDYMRENGVYDNTRIILVSDHGGKLEQWDEFMLEDGEDISVYYPLLMVKEFDKEGFMVSEEFMTNGDVPTLAVEDIIDDPINPFTQKPVNMDDKSAHDQFVFTSHEWDIEKNEGNTFNPGKWYAVHNDMRDVKNWKLVAENSVLPED